MGLNVCCDELISLSLLERARRLNTMDERHLPEVELSLSKSEAS